MQALLIIDIQNDYFEGGANVLTESLEASKNAAKLLSWFRTHRQPVIHIQHVSARPGASFFVQGTEGAEIHASVKPLDGEKVIMKHYPNSFRDTELLSYLQENNVDKLVVCGMMTHMCVDTTVRAAKDLGFDCTLIGDACATLDLSIDGNTVEAKDVQNSFLAALSYFFATVISSDQFLKLG